MDRRRPAEFRTPPVFRGNSPRAGRGWGASTVGGNHCFRRRAQGAPCPVNVLETDCSNVCLTRARRALVWWNKFTEIQQNVGYVFWLVPSVSCDASANDNSEWRSSRARTRCPRNQITVSLFCNGPFSSTEVWGCFFISNFHSSWGWNWVPTFELGQAVVNCDSGRASIGDGIFFIGM